MAGGIERADQVNKWCADILPTDQYFWDKM